MTRDPAGNLYGTSYLGGTAGLGIVYKVDTAGHEKVLYNFTDQCFPSAVVLDTAGNLYGACFGIASTYAGVVFKLDSTGLATVLHTFTGGADGANPIGVILDSAGDLYGATQYGGAGGGVVYKMDSTGNETVLYSFVDDGFYPSSLVLDPAGNIYGTTLQGGIYGAGVVYKLDTAGHERVLYTFTDGFDGGLPYDLVRDDAMGFIWGLARGGPTNGGLLFTLDGLGNFNVAHFFGAEAGDGVDPNPGLTLEGANLYGTTISGGAYGLGTVYSGDGGILYSFPGGVNGEGPHAGVIRDPAGNLYGTASEGGAEGLGVLYKLDAAGNESVFNVFTPAPSGSQPAGPLIRDAAGNLYGTAVGGVWNAGVVFKIDPSGAETVLYTFKGQPDGNNPTPGLIRDSAGDLYGTTEAGGVYGQGTIYKLDASSNETVLYSFTGGSDGAMPFAGVTLDAAGNLYGTTSEGGLSSGSGVVYELEPGGNEIVLYSFTGGADGGSPFGGVVLDAAGNLYGTTYGGGLAEPCTCGVVFKIDPNGNETVLHSFEGDPDGANPAAGVIRDSSGNLYGTTFDGGSKQLGVVYKLDPTGAESVLHYFRGRDDGASPTSGVIRDAAGNLYGTTQSGGAPGFGVVYELGAGHEDVLYSFTDGSDGGSPNGGVIAGQGGILYGVARTAGKYGGGVVFEISRQ